MLHVTLALAALTVALHFDRAKTNALPVTFLLRSLRGCSGNNGCASPGSAIPVFDQADTEKAARIRICLVVYFGNVTIASEKCLEL